MSRVFCLQDWVTIRGADTITVVQDEERWLDLEGFSDATCWIDVAEVTPPGSSNWLAFSLETAACFDDAYFTPMTPVMNLGASTVTQFYRASATPFVLRSTRSLASSNLMRYVRWKIVPFGDGSSTWDLTFRIRVAATRSRAFVPTDLSGCVLWLRGDLGITLNGANVSGWADQSGNGHDASATVGAQPDYQPSAVSGLPAIQGDGSSMYMTTAPFSLGSSTSIFTVVQPTAPQAGYARILEQEYDTSYYLGTTQSSGGYKFIATDGTYPFGNAETTTLDSAPSLVSATYASGSPHGVGTIYYNGQGSTPDTVSFSNPTASPAVYLMRKDNVAASYWTGYLAEVVAYDRLLDPNELLRVHRYLGGRYGIAVP